MTRTETGGLRQAGAWEEREKTPPRLFRCNPCPPGQGCSQTNGPRSTKVCNDCVISKRLSGITVIMSKNREGQTGWPHHSTPGKLLPRKGCVCKAGGRRGEVGSRGSAWRQGAEPARPGSQAGLPGAEPLRQLGCRFLCQPVSGWSLVPVWV